MRFVVDWYKGLGWVIVDTDWKEKMVGPCPSKKAALARAAEFEAAGTSYVMPPSVQALIDSPDYQADLAIAEAELASGGGVAYELVGGELVRRRGS